MKKIVLYTLLLIFVGSSVFPSITMETSKSVISLFFTTLLPSFLFPLIIVRILSPYHLLTPFLKPFKKVIFLLFGMDVQTFEIICTSLFLGFPSSSIYLEEYALTLPKDQYERLTYLPFMASSSFILLSLSSVYEPKITKALLMIQIISIFIMLFFTRKTSIQLQTEPLKISFLTQVTKASKKTYEILKMILVYLVLVQVSIEIGMYYFPESIKIPFKILCEFSSGTFFLSSLSFSMPYKMILTTLLLSYGGLCVHLQLISSMSTSFQYKKFLVIRIKHMLLSLLLSILFI